MPNITSFEILDAEIKKIDGKPTVLEALWDGDTDGWFLMLSLYYTTDNLFGKEEKAIDLGIVSFGGDIRLFNGQVPLWPEAELAKQLGAEAAEKYELTFYFPSDKYPDSDCPPWPKRHLGIHCTDCGKLIIPTNSPYLPKDICYHCHLEREHNLKLKKDTPEEDKIKMFLFKNGVYEGAAWLQELVDNIKLEGNNEIKTVTVGLPDILEIRESVRIQIETLLSSYRVSDLVGEKRKFGLFESIFFEGRTYELETRFNHDHQQISSLAYRYSSTSKAISEGWVYKVIFSTRITYRDDSILRFIYFVSRGETETSTIIERYKKAVQADEILKTIMKLEKMGLVTIKGDIVTTTETGGHIL